VVKATVDALSKLRTRTQIFELRGKKRPPRPAAVEVSS